MEEEIAGEENSIVEFEEKEEDEDEDEGNEEEPDDDEDLSRYHASKLLRRHEAINVALLDIAALERVLSEEGLEVPEALLRALADDFRSLDDLQRQLCVGLEQCAVARGALADKLHTERAEKSIRVQDCKAHEEENQRRIERLSGELNALAKEATGIDVQIKRLRAEALLACEKKRGEKKRYEVSVGRLNEVLKENKLRRQAEMSAAQGLQELQDNCVKLGEEVNELREAALKEAEEHEKQKEETEERIKELTQRLSAQRKENAQLSEVLAVAEEELDELKEVAAAAEKAAAAAAAKVAAAEARAAEVAAERKRQAERKAAIEEAIQDLKQKITDLEEKDKKFRKESESQISQLDQEIGERGKQLRDVHAQKSALSEELERVRSVCATREADARRAQEESERLEAEVARRATDARNARMELEALKRRADELRRMDAARGTQWERECVALRTAAREAKQRLEPAKARMRNLRQLLTKEQRKADARLATRAERLRQAKRQLELEHVMIASLDRSLSVAKNKKAALDLHQALLRDADKMAAAHHAHLMESQWRETQSLRAAEQRLLRGVAALEVTRERLREQTEAETTLLHSLLDDVAALSETAQMLQREQSVLEDEILDFNVALEAHGLHALQEFPLPEEEGVSSVA